MPEAAVIIPHYNDTARLLRCLEVLMGAVATINKAAPDRVEVVVVDNASTVSLEDVRAHHPDLRIVTEPKKGAAEARNRGVRETTAPRLFFLDADCVPAADWLSVAFDTAARADLVGGHVSVFDETPPPRSGAEAFETVFAFDFKTYIEKKGFSGTGNLLTRRDVFFDVGDFVPGLSEDLNWCHRATAKGYSLIYAETLQVAHPTRSDWPALRRKWQRITQESYGLIESDRSAHMKWAIRGLAMVPSIPVHAARVIFSPQLSGFGEKAAALLTLTQLRLLRCKWMLQQALGRQI